MEASPRAWPSCAWGDLILTLTPDLNFDFDHWLDFDLLDFAHFLDLHDLNLDPHDPHVLHDRLDLDQSSWPGLPLELVVSGTAAPDPQSRWRLRKLDLKFHLEEQ